ncbi:hypothetical protein I4F81_011353 [Pyropia yezoensis]|uniref:Uncharacterized protein n=1 Tax=Pyropia yezoensis TaxID=2788 RepID=A0ACC3CFV1_PYRYE|nr:hypothetical protein I4F81_011353 [Neopyropia yezoensis]
MRRLGGWRTWSAAAGAGGSARSRRGWCVGGTRTSPPTSCSTAARKASGGGGGGGVREGGACAFDGFFFLPGAVHLPVLALGAPGTSAALRRGGRGGALNVVGPTQSSGGRPPGSGRWLLARAPVGPRDGDGSYRDNGGGPAAALGRPQRPRGSGATALAPARQRWQRWRRGSGGSGGGGGSGGCSGSGGSPPSSTSDQDRRDWRCKGGHVSCAAAATSLAAGRRA